MTSIDIDNAKCDRLVARAAAGDGAAARTLVETLWPIWVEMVRSSRSMRSLANLEDGVHDVVARLVEKFGQPGSRGLGLYLAWKERNGDRAFEDWLRIVTQNTIRDYLREKLGTRRNPSATSEEPSLKRLLNEFTSSPAVEELGVRPPLTLAQTARELLEFATTRLQEQPLSVLKAWLEGASFEDIAVECGLSPEHARQQLRAAVAVLRRHFAGAAS